MPNGDGLFLLKYIKQNYPKLPVILLSGFTEASAISILEMGALAFIGKPTDLDELVKMVQVKFLV